MLKIMDKYEKIIIINQPSGLGDILFTIPIAREFIKQGYTVIYPYNTIFGNIGKHFPDIIFIDQKELKFDYESREERRYNNVRIIPMRWSNGTGCIDERTMLSKYDLVDLPVDLWHTLTWERDFKKENELRNKLPKKYILVNKNWHYSMLQRDIKIKSYIPIVEMSILKGYTMLDWGRVLEDATEIHTVGTSLVYMLEVLGLKAHLYRRPGEYNFRNYDYLLKIKHEYHYDL